MYKMLTATFTANTKSATPTSQAKRPSVIRSPLLQRLTLGVSRGGATRALK
jgi:hypothetical protein